MRKLILLFLFFSELSLAQEGELYLIVETDTIDFKDELKVFLKMNNQEIKFNNGKNILFDRGLKISEIKEILVVFKMDSIFFFSNNNFSEETIVYNDTIRSNMPSLTIPSFKEAYFSKKNMYLSITNHDERLNYLKHYPENIRKYTEQQIKSDNGKTTFNLRYHLTETKRLKLKTSL